MDLSLAFPPNRLAGAATIHNGMSGYLACFRYGGLEIRFFSMTTLIPWSFVASVAARLRQNTVMGFTGLHGTVFMHEGTKAAVFVTLTAAGVPVPWVGPG